MSERKRRKVSVGQLAALKPYEGWSRRRLEEEARRLNAATDEPEEDLQQEVEELMRLCRVPLAVGRPKIKAIVRIRRRLADADRLPYREVRELTQSLNALEESVGFAERTRSTAHDRSALETCQAKAASHVLAHLVALNMRDLEREEQIVFAEDRPAEAEAELAEIRERMRHREREVLPAAFQEAMRNELEKVGINPQDVPGPWFTYQGGRPRPQRDSPSEEP